MEEGPGRANRQTAARNGGAALASASPQFATMEAMRRFSTTIVEITR